MMTQTNIRNFPLSTSLGIFIALLGAITLPATAAAQSNIPVGRVVISGTVPDETTKALLLTKLQEVYGTGQVVDQISVGGVVAPASWATAIPKLINPNLKSISKGQLAIDGTTVSMRGEVASESAKQSLANDFANTLNSTYTIKNGLRVTAATQVALDQTLANRTIEFEKGSALLTPSGKRILDEMTETLMKVHAKKIDLIGHTDDIGSRARNMALSQARADSVKFYLVAKGLPSDIIATNGMGPDQPIMSNNSQEGRQRNRRIEFRVSQ
jgi:OOP family OmpA-OmpF porin